MPAQHFESLTHICRRIKSGELSSVAVTQALLERIGSLEPKLHAYAMVLDDAALAQAAACDARRANGEPLGMLHGVPIAIKDLLFTRGVATASGTLVMRDFIPDYTATVVHKLEKAGAVIIGKTQLTEGAFGAHHPSIASPVNPWQPGRWPGVSSSGSGVGVAAGLAYGALGTDTGGSIRFPSAACGLVGIKGTYGRVSRYGAFELAASLDHIGPMTRSVEDAARLLTVLAGQDPADPTTLPGTVPNYVQELSQSARGMVIGIDWRYVTQGVNPVVVEHLRNACDTLVAAGATIKEVTMPASYQRLVDEWGVTCGVECARAHAETYPARKAEYGPVLASLIELGRNVSQAQYDELQNVRESFRQALEGLFSEVDLIACPSMPNLTPTMAEAAAPIAIDEADYLTFTAPFDYSGHPTISLPIALHDRLPTSLQLVAGLQNEAALIRAGSAYEHERGEFGYPEPNV